jgi:WD40 repeat protein
MNKHHLLCVCLLSLIGSLFTLPVRAQQRCQPPAPPAIPQGKNIFTPQQEMDLGDAVAEQFQRDYRVIQDDELTGYLRRVGERLVKQLPTTDLRFQFFLYDQPEANAFTIPGGRVYVSRKLIAFARSEDELAGVLAHELGHNLAHESAIGMTCLFRQVLKVEQVGDRRDIFEKYHQLVENIGLKPGACGGGAEHEEKGQLVADQVALYAMTLAGYDPRAFATFWDRLAETKGKTGGWFSDVFGTTKPDERRLREILKVVNAIPADCVALRSAAGSASEFQKWQGTVINYSGLGSKEALHDVVWKKQLEPPLRGDITYLRFSPDGKYVLAQDDSGINVLSRDPFKLLFRIDAPEAHSAQFTPDSHFIVFYNSNLRVESWSLDDQKQKSVREMVILKGCLQTELAPDGKTLACLSKDFDLTLYDVATDAQVFQKKSIYTPRTYAELFGLLLYSILNADEGELNLINMGFSPDARYFVAGYNDSAIAVDMMSREAVPLRGQLKRFIGGGFTFTTPDRIVGIDASDVKKAALVSFPEGQVLSELSVGRARLSPATHGNYLMIRPVQDFPVGIMDLNTKKIFMANKQSAVDIYDQVFVGEQRNGEIGLYDMESGALRAKVIMPRNPFGRLRAAALSPDLKWLAVSERSRGAVWDLTKGERVLHIRGFRGAHIAGGTLYADFPKFEETSRLIARFDLASRRASEGMKIEDDTNAFQYGPFVAVMKPAKKGAGLSENIIMEVHDAVSGATLWTKEFPKESPRLWVDPNEGTMALLWSVSSNAAKAEIKADPVLSSRLSMMKEKEGDYFIRTLDAQTGRPTGALLIETGKGSFRIEEVRVAGNWVMISDTKNRVLVYSLSSGEQRGHFFGRRPAISKAAGLLAVENERGQLILYDLDTMQKRDQFLFPSAISLTQFSADGRQLFVLTADQTAYVLNLGEKQG